MDVRMGIPVRNYLYFAKEDIPERSDEIEGDVFETLEQALSWVKVKGFKGWYISDTDTFKVIRESHK